MVLNSKILANPEKIDKLGLNIVLCIDVTLA